MHALGVAQGIALYTDNGRDRPVSYVLETPGYGCVVQINNDGPMEYPLTASLAPYSVNPHKFDHEPPGGVLGGGDPPRRRGRYDPP